MNILLNKGNRLIEKDLNLVKILKTLKSLKVIMNQLFMNPMIKYEMNHIR